MCTIQATIVSILAVTHQQVVWKQPVITWLMYYDLGIFLYMNYAILLIYIYLKIPQEVQVQLDSSTT